MIAKVVDFALCTLLLALCFPAEAQQAKKIPRVGYLTGTSLSGNPNRIMAFRQGLRELGYVEAKNIVIEWRSAEENRDRERTLAVELTQLKVDVIVTGGGGSTRAAKEATSAIPIVMTNDGDPIGNGFVASLAHPGGNITGLSTVSPELSGKRLEVLKEIVPRLSRVSCLRDFKSGGQLTRVKRDRTRRWGVWDKSSIPRRAGSEGYRDFVPSRS